MSTEVEETLQRIKSHSGVKSVLVVNKEGVPIHHEPMGQEEAVQHASTLTQLTMKARSVVRDLDPQDDLKFLRIRTTKGEIMVAPDNDYMLIVVQDPSAQGN